MVVVANIKSREEIEMNWIVSHLSDQKAGSAKDSQNFLPVVTFGIQVISLSLSRKFISHRSLYLIPIKSSTQNNYFFLYFINNFLEVLFPVWLSWLLLLLLFFLSSTTHSKDSHCLCFSSIFHLDFQRLIVLWFLHELNMFLGQIIGSCNNHLDFP